MRKIILVFLCLCLYGCSKVSYLDNYNRLTTSDYNELYDLENCVFISLSYYETLDMIENDTFVFYFGGSWCPNCQVVAPLINEVALENNISVYNFDPRNNEYTAEDDFRNCNDDEQLELYKNFIEILGYTSDTTVYIEDEYGNKVDTTIPRLSVPALFAIKDGKIQYSLIQEYTQEDLTEEVIQDYKGKLQELINCL